VLIVDDHEDTREIYAWCMMAAGWHVDAVTNGAEALAIAAAHEPDVIVMDLHLPVLDGLATTHRLKQDPRTAHIPVVACTAFGHLHSEAEMREAGFEALVAKPCPPEDLRAVLEEVVADRDT
jgi:CheY-like chemotaxis protein